MAEKWSSNNCLDKLVAFVILLSSDLCETSSREIISVDKVKI